MRGKANHVKLLLCVLLLALPAKAKYGGGTGEPNDPYLIYTAEQMNTIGAEPNDWDKHFRLMADIDLSSYTGTDFNIIGTGYLPAFTGVFDGDGHTISNFTYTSTDSLCIGIFGYIEGPNARIINLGLIDPNVDAGTGAAIGPLAGWIDMGTVTNCYAVGGSIAGEAYVGGLVGRSAGTIADCYATGSVTGFSFVGGLVGASSSTINNCYSSASVTGYHGNVGGLVGYSNGGTITNCYSTYSVDGRNEVGGLVGKNSGKVGNCYSYCTVDAEDLVGGLVGSNDGLVMASYSHASVTGWVDVGGLVGYNSHVAETINCYAKGDVLGQMYVGGLVGNNVTGGRGGPRSGTIRNCYSAAAVSGDEQVGGLVGRDGDGGVSGSFWDIEASGQTTSYGGTGKTTAEMQDPNTFTDEGWAFVGTTPVPCDVWAEPDGGGYPILWWQLSPLPGLPTFSGGTGEPDNPYLISTADELNSIGSTLELMAASFRLIADIDLAGVDSCVIASRLYPFSGTFDGDGHTISNFSYTSADATCIGLVACAVGAEIKDLGLIGPSVNLDRGAFHGCLVGHLHAGTITNCYVETGSVSGSDYVGGLVGSNGGAVTNCYFTGDVYGYDNVGGLVGENSGTVTNCRSSCSVDGSDNAGGLVGYNGGSVMVSYTYASVAGDFLGLAALSDATPTEKLSTAMPREMFSANVMWGALWVETPQVSATSA